LFLGGFEMTVEETADQLANAIFYHNTDAQMRERLYQLLLVFASEIRRSAIEP